VSVHILQTRGALLERSAQPYRIPERVESTERQGGMACSDDKANALGLPSKKKVYDVLKTKRPEVKASLRLKSPNGEGGQKGGSAEAHVQWRVIVVSKAADVPLANGHRPRRNNRQHLKPRPARPVLTIKVSE